MAEQSREQLPYREDLRWLLTHQNKWINIPRILNFIQLNEVDDANDDNKINCIDYSVIFQALYGSDARLMVNRNPKTGMNHMFVRIFIKESFIDIDPQGTVDSYFMQEIWGDKYDPKFNKDETEKWRLK